MIQVMINARMISMLISIGIFWRGELVNLSPSCQERLTNSSWKQGVFSFLLHGENQLTHKWQWAIFFRIVLSFSGSCCCPACHHRWRWNAAGLLVIQESLGANAGVAMQRSGLMGSMASGMATGVEW
jgi:hypothetical protein